MCIEPMGERHVGHCAYLHDHGLVVGVVQCMVVLVMKLGARHLGLRHTEAQRGRLWTAYGQRRVDSKNIQTTPAQPQYANYWAPLTRKWHTMPHLAQPRHTNHWAPRTRKRHQQEQRP